MRSSKLFGSIRFRMVIIYLLVTVAALLATNMVVSTLLEEALVSQRTQAQVANTSELARSAAELSEADADRLFAFFTEQARSLSGRVLLLDTDAVTQMDSASQLNGYRLPYREVREVLVGGKSSAYGFHQIARDQEKSGILAMGEETVWAVYYAAPVTVNGTVVGCVVLSSLIQDVQESIQAMVRKVTLIFIVVAAAMALITFVLSGWLTKPIVELTGAIRRMGTQGYGERVKPKGSGEIAELSIAFNRMSERIEDHDRVRDEFIANASHELKTPLATMKLLSESILYDENPDPAMMKEFFSDVNHEMDRLTRIVTDLLRLVQDDRTEARLTLTEVKLDEMAARVTERLRPLSVSKNLTLQLETKPVSVSADPLRMEQVMVNLIENAIKYTDAGSVFVEVRPEQRNAVFRVKDSGIGIPEEAKAHLFERFYRVDKARSRGTGGTGLGLAIVEKTVLLHGGTIEVDSVLGEGSTFTVRLPLGGVHEEA